MDVITEPRNLCGWVITELMRVDEVVFSNVLLNRKGSSLGFPDIFDRDKHLLGLKVNPMLVALPMVLSRSF